MTLLVCGFLVFSRNFGKFLIESAAFLIVTKLVSLRLTDCVLVKVVVALRAVCPQETLFTRLKQTEVCLCVDFLTILFIHCFVFF